MRYLGSKARISKPIVEFLSSVRKSDQLFIEPFCGSCSISMLMEGPVLCNDIHTPLIEMFKGLQNGWVPADRVYTESDYKFIKSNQCTDLALKGAVGFHFGFGGKFFGIYARDKKGASKDLNSVVQTRKMFNSLRNIKSLIGHITFKNVDYRKLVVPRGSLVYCDPPYLGTHEYSNKGFNTPEFWNWVRGLSRYSQVYVSEYVAPKDFKCVLELERTEKIASNIVGVKKIEKLFILK